MIRSHSRSYWFHPLRMLITDVFEKGMVSLRYMFTRWDMIVDEEFLTEALLTCLDILTIPMESCWEIAGCQISRPKCPWFGGFLVRSLWHFIDNIQHFFIHRCSTSLFFRSSAKLFPHLDAAPFPFKYINFNSNVRSVGSSQAGRKCKA